MRQVILSLASRFVRVFFSTCSIAITSLREERTGRAFVCIARVGLCLFTLPLGVECYHYFS